MFTTFAPLGGGPESGIRIRLALAAGNVRRISGRAEAVAFGATAKELIFPAPDEEGVSVTLVSLVDKLTLALLAGETFHLAGDFVFRGDGFPGDFVIDHFPGEESIF